MLLDVNVLLAITWTNHQHHAVARRWFDKQRRKGWATCAVTELGFIRLSSNPAFTKEAASPAEACDVLTRLRHLGKHRFLPCDLSPSELGAAWRQTMGYRQTTDVYLALLAQHHGVQLATLDRKLLAHPGLKDAARLIEVG